MINSYETRKRRSREGQLNKKRDGQIIDRIYDNGNTQRQYLPEGENIYSPTCTTKALMATLVVNSMERRYVATFDVLGSFTQTEMQKCKNSI